MHALRAHRELGLADEQLCVRRALGGVVHGRVEQRLGERLDPPKQHLPNTAQPRPLESKAAARRADAAQFTAVDFSKLQQMSTAVNINKRDRRSIEELEQEQKELKEKKAKH